MNTSRCSIVCCAFIVALELCLSIKAAEVDYIDLKDFTAVVEEELTDFDGDGHPDNLDNDDDNDGIPDDLDYELELEGLPPDDTDGDGIPDYADLDVDGDGIPDDIPPPPPYDSVGDQDGAGDFGGPIDTDGDGIPDYLDNDVDGDGIQDKFGLPVDENGDGIPDYPVDSDGDGIPDNVDAGGGFGDYRGPADFDNDGIPDYMDEDDDNDGIVDEEDDELNVDPPPDQDGDGIPDYADEDVDGDGIPDVPPPPPPPEEDLVNITDAEYRPPPVSVDDETFTPLVIDDSEKEDAAPATPELYQPGELPRPRFVMLGQQGVGKSSLANTLLGFDNLASLTNKRVRKKLPFKIGHGLRSKTRMTSFSTGRYLGTGPNVTVVDTPGFKDTDDAEFIDEIMNVLGDEVEEVDSFLIVYKYKDRFTRPFKRTLTMITKMFGNFWTNVVLVVNFWSFKETHVDERQGRGVTMKTYSKQLRNIFQQKFDLEFELPVVFIDTHYNKSNPEELTAFTRETDKLWKVTLDRKPFQCLTRKDVQDNLKREKEDLASMRRNCRSTKRRNTEMSATLATQKKQIEAQMFVMNNLRNGIDYLKEHCSKADASDVILGCQWSDWTDWSSCTRSCGGGTVRRLREKLPGLGTCDGPDSEEEACENEVCPLENDSRSLVVVIGGETSVSRENEHSTSVEVLGPSGRCRHSGVPDLPEGRGKMCAAYDPSGAIIVCGGGERFWRPNANCWQLLAGASHEWQPIPQLYPVHGAAVAFSRGKLWVLGGSTGDDSYDHTITDKVQAYQPREQQWSVEQPLTSPRHKACAVAVDDMIVITGGTMLGLGKVKPVWLAEIGTRNAEEFDGETWTDLPSMSRAKVEHGCAVVTIGGSRGVLVVGGATGDDMAEFLDWENKGDGWRTLGKLHRGRGMMPGIGFIGGTLSVVGGYSWPGGVGSVEQWDDDNAEWVKANDAIKLKYPRFNHGTVTVPGGMFPQCLDPPPSAPPAKKRKK